MTNNIIWPGGTTPYPLSNLPIFIPARFQNQFRFETESSGMNDNYKKVLYDGRLSNSIVFMYNPVSNKAFCCRDEFNEHLREWHLLLHYRSKVGYMFVPGKIYPTSSTTLFSTPF